MRDRKRRAPKGMDIHHLFAQHRYPRLRRKCWNQVVIHLERHRAWHRMFGLRTIEEVIICLATRDRVNPKWFGAGMTWQTVGSPNWVATFGERSIEDVLHILCRLRDIKYSLR